MKVPHERSRGWAERLFPSPMRHPEIIRQGWIRGLPLHNFLVFLYHLARIPLPITALAIGALCLATAHLFGQPPVAAAILGVAAGLDLLLLALLPLLRLSFGWIQPPWLLFSVGRHALALAVAALPLAPAPQLVMLGLLQALLTGLAFYAALVEPFAVRHTHLSLPVCSPAGPPLRLLLLTDLHIERRTRREHAVLEVVRRERPDAILVGGDLLNLSYVGEPTAVAEARCFLGALQAPLGVFMVRGTRDVDVPHVVTQILDGLAIRALENERVTVCKGTTCVDLVGIPADRGQAELSRALERLVDGARHPVLCLHHTPDLVEDAARRGVALYLAGHTHGGQICLPLLGPVATASRFGRRYVRGLHRLGTTVAYVSRGLGLEGLGAPRMRFMAPPELVWVTLGPRDTTRESG